MNAKDELLEVLEETGKCIEDIEFLHIYVENWDEKPLIYIAVSQLDFNYDSGFGGQELFGYVVFKDKTWLERGEYDGSEWWEYKKCPSKGER